MKRWFLTLACLLSVVFSFGQSADCATAVPFCTSMSYNIPLATNTTAQVGPDYDCLYSQPNPAWYFLQISVSGPLTIHMASSPGVVDIDFACWGPFTTLTNACNNLTNVVDCSYSAANTENCVIPNAVVDQFYILVITNYGNTPTNVAFSQTAGTGATDCTIIPPTCTTEAGNHQDVCGLDATLVGDLSPATTTTGLWTGTGVFGTAPQATTTITAPAYNHYVYTLTETNTNGCIATDTVSVDFYEDPLYNIPNPTASVCALSYQLQLSLLNTGTGTFAASTNSSGAWTWTGPVGAMVTFTPNAQTPNALATVSMYGTYIFTWTGSNGPCGTTAQIIVTFNANPLFGVNTTPELCTNACDGTAQIIGLPFPYTTTPFFPQTNLCPGNYTVTLTDGNGCLSSAPYTIVAATPLTHTETHTDLLCNQDHTGTILLTPLGGAGNFTYAWSPPVSTGAQATGLAATNYLIVVQDGNGCTYTENISLSEPPLLTTQITITDSTLCLGTVTTLTDGVLGGTPPYTYLWSELSITNAITVSPLSTGAIQVVVRDQNNCLATDQQMIYVSSPLMIDAVPTDILCAETLNGSVTLNITGGVLPYTYSWASPTNTLTGLAAGTYSVVVTDAYQCAFSTPYTIGSPLPLTYTSTVVNPVCHDQTGTITISAQGGTPPYTYQWSDNNQGPQISRAEGDVSLILADAHQCTTTGNFTLTAPEALYVWPPANPTLCYGTSTNLAANTMGGTYPYTYHWSTNQVQPQITVSPLVSTQYSFYVEDAHGCLTSPIYITVNVTPVLQLSLTVFDDTICPLQAAKINVNASGGNGGPYLIYVNGEIQSIPLLLSPPTDQWYYIRLSDGCTVPSVMDSVWISVQDVPVSFTVDHLRGCEPYVISFNNNTLQSPAYTYQWNFGDGATSTAYLTNHTYQAGTYDVSLTVTTPQGCKFTNYQTELLTIWPLPQPRFDRTPTFGNRLQPGLQFNNTSLGNQQNYWSFGDGDSSLQTNPYHIFPGVGTYLTCLVATTEHGCKDTLCQPIMIQDLTQFWMPTAFSPDADGRNDFFGPIGFNISLQNYYFGIYDRWGAVIYTSTSVDHQWNGKNSQQEIVPSGIYVWYVHYLDVQGVGHDARGYVTLLR